MKKTELYELYASCKFTTYHYKILFLLLKNSYTQKEISNKLGVAKQNINKTCKELLSMDLIKVSKVIGNNKYLEINKNPKLQIKGQLKIL